MSEAHDRSADDKAGRDRIKKQGGVHFEGGQPSISGPVIGGDVGRLVYQGLTVEQVAELLLALKRQEQPVVWDGRIPYIGLNAFRERDARFFFGRESLVDELLERVRQARFVVIAGPSGSGKSSVARAGLFYALSQGALADSDTWLLATMRPGGDPLENLALCFERVTGSLPLGDTVRQDLSANPQLWSRLVNAVLSDDPRQRLVLLVDQFEEIFTQTGNEALRAGFIELLATAVEDARTTILVSIRSDFISHCARYPRLRALLSRQFQLVGAMAPRDLAKAITLPALEVGATIDPALVTRIMADMGGEPGALPLMSFALRDLFEAQMPQKGEPMVMTLAEYLQRGGIESALERHANKVFAEFSEEQQQLAKVVFSRLITVGQDSVDTRRTVNIQELVPAGTTLEEITAVITTLAKEGVRLITVGAEGQEEDADLDDAQATVTIAHEKLIDAWPWLRQLVDENREAILLQNQISAAAREWASEEDEGFLYRGGRLLQVEERLAALQPQLDALSQRFIATSLALRQQELERAEAQRRRELEQERRLAEEQRRRAIEAEEATAVQRRLTRNALGQSLAALAPQIIKRNNDTELATLLALQAWRTGGKQGAWLKDDALRSILAQPYFNTTLQTGSDWVLSLAISPDEQWLATGNEDASIRLLALKDPQYGPIVLRGHEDPVWSITYSPDGQFLATADFVGAIHLWDLTSIISTAQKSRRVMDNSPGPHVQLLEANYTESAQLAFSPDGKLLASGHMDGVIRLWDIDAYRLPAAPSPERLPILIHGLVEGVSSLLFKADSRFLFAGYEDGAIRLWDVEQAVAQESAGGRPAPASFAQDDDEDANDDRELPVHTGEILALAVTPDGNFFASGDSHGTVRLWPLSSVRNPQSFDRDRQGILWTTHNDAVHSLAFTPDGQTLAVGYGSGAILLWPTALMRPHVHVIPYSAQPKTQDELPMDDERAVHLLGQVTAVDFIAFIEEGKTMVTHYDDGTIRLWDVSVRNTLPYSRPPGAALIVDGHAGSIWSARFAADGRHLLSAGADGQVLGHDVAAMLDPNPAPTQIGPFRFPGIEHELYGLALSGNGRTLACGSRGGRVYLWDVSLLSNPNMTLNANSPDNSLSQPVILGGDGQDVVRVAFDAGGRFLAGGMAGGTIQIWDIAQLSWGASARSRPEPITLPAHSERITALAFSPDGRSLISAGYDGLLLLWDLSALAELLSPEYGQASAKPHFAYTQLGTAVRAFAAQFSRDGRTLASGHEDNIIRLWDVASVGTAQGLELKAPLRLLGETTNVEQVPPLKLKGHESTVTALTFSRDGQILASGSDDNTIRLWDMEDPQAEAVVLSGHQRMVSSVDFSPDGRYLLSTSLDKTMRIWPMREHLIAIGCQMVRRNLTRDEWARYLFDEPYERTCPELPEGRQ